MSLLSDGNPFTKLGRKVAEKLGLTASEEKAAELVPAEEPDEDDGPWNVVPNRGELRAIGMKPSSATSKGGYRRHYAPRGNEGLPRHPLANPGRVSKKEAQRRIDQATTLRAAYAASVEAEETWVGPLEEQADRDRRAVNRRGRQARRDARRARR